MLKISGSYGLKYTAGLKLALKTFFGKVPYPPIRDLFMNPWFWIIIVFIIILVLAFRRR